MRTWIAVALLLALAGCAREGKKADDVGTDAAADTAGDAPLDTLADTSGDAATDAPLPDRVVPDGPAEDPAADPTPPDQADETPQPDVGDVVAPDATDVVPDSADVPADLPPATGTITVKGTFSLADAPVEPGNGGYLVLLVDHTYIPGGNPGPYVLAAYLLATGMGYTGDPVAIPVGGGTLNVWDNTSEEGDPLTSTPYQASPGPYYLLVVYMPMFGDSSPSHAAMQDFDVPSVPWEKDLGTIALAPSVPQPSCPFEGTYGLKSIACAELDITEDFKSFVASTVVTITALDGGGGCHVVIQNGSAACQEEEQVNATTTDYINWEFAFLGVTACEPAACQFNADDAPCELGDRSGYGTGKLQEIGNGELQVIANAPGDICTEMEKTPSIMTLVKQ